ncbi:hypothetical protein FRC17_007142, partial [Serendipita sp. 399]
MASSLVYDPVNGNKTQQIKIENVVQYYQASSFVLAYKVYNNTFALSTTTEAGYDQRSLLPEVVCYSDFYKCIDRVLADGIPIVDRTKKKNKAGMIAGIVIGSVAFIFLADGLAHTRTQSYHNPHSTLLNELSYFDTVVNECLRVHLPFETTIRIARADDVISVEKPFLDRSDRWRDRIYMKKGDGGFLPLLLMNRLEEIWGSDAAEF